MSFDIAREFAIKAHGDQKYGFYSYSYHLDAVVKMVFEQGHDHLSKEQLQNAVVLAYLHDTVEDTETTLEDIREHFGSFISDCVHLLTDEPGANRAERKAATYAKLKAVPEGDTTLAHFVKACDRMANIKEALEPKNRTILKMYLDEGDALLEALEGKVHPRVHQAMTDQLWDVEYALSKHRSG